VTDNDSPKDLDVRLILDSLPVLVFTFSPNGEVELINKPILDYFGRTFEELRAWRGSDLFHPDDLAPMTRTWETHIAAGTAYSAEHRLRRADGVYRWFRLRASPIRDREGRVLHWHGDLTDIDELKRAETAAREAERALALILDSIPAMVFTTKATGELEWVNHNILGYFGRTLEDLQAWQFSDSVHPDDLAHTIAEWTAGARSGKPYGFEQRLRRADGAYRWFEFRAAPQHDDDGSLLRWHGLVTDIHEQKIAQADMRTLHARLARASQIATVSHLAAAVAHEVSQPLAAVVANGHACRRWLVADPPNLERARLGVERLVRDSNTAVDVINRVRALFRHSPPVTSDLNLNEVIEESLRLIADDVVQRRVSLELHLQRDLPNVAADRVQMQQLIINLARNGIDAMADLSSEKSLLLRSRELNGEVIVEVTDVGAGLADGTVVFEPFYTTKSSGMGMGLSICKSIVDAHGGRLEAAPNLDRGATFRFALSASRREAL